ncbi:hypothetical protein EYC80_007797 [Monilinia laxa]|uniref:Uncharacterized protein n=1 Tax=Monilinia laxa TaxID=61186 RepID=A0A5N6JX19_MONLA|nr:hypothetical protein EYC80_007797 [Monilinia laxa]
MKKRVDVNIIGVVRISAGILPKSECGRQWVSFISAQKVFHFEFYLSMDVSSRTPFFTFVEVKSITHCTFQTISNERRLYRYVQNVENANQKISMMLTRHAT